MQGICHKININEVRLTELGDPVMAVTVSNCGQPPTEQHFTDWNELIDFIDSLSNAGELAFGQEDNLDVVKPVDSLVLVNLAVSIIRHFLEDCSDPALRAETLSMVSELLNINKA